MLDKFEGLVNRLVAKIEFSQTPVPGFMIGLSGSDSILAFLVLYEALQRRGMEDRLVGIHYKSGKPTWFENDIFPWLKARCPRSVIFADVPLGGNQDPQRWADLHLRVNAKGEDHFIPRDQGENYWISGSINQTEKLLGKYSLLANCVSIQPIITVYKSQVLVMCAALGVPEIAMKRSRLPDCLCGREELAANNIELIDKILSFDSDAIPMPNEDMSELRAKLSIYIRDTKRANDFKMRIPYII